MSRAHPLPITALVLIVAVPLGWFACGGGESKPAESPAEQSAEQSSSAASSAEPAASEAPAAAASSAAAEAPAASSPPAETTAAAAPAPPPAPSFANTDCGKCIDKTCSKEAAACGKNNDCQATLDTIHACSSSGASCLDSGTAPSAAKPKKLATAYEKCGKKAAAKACKAKCQ